MAKIDHESFSAKSEDHSSPAWRKDRFKGYAHTTARRNQLLATDWGALSPIDITKLRDNCADALGSAQSLTEAEAVLLVLAILCTGRSAENWMDCWISPSERTSPHALRIEKISIGWLIHLPVDETTLDDRVDASSGLIDPSNQLRWESISLLSQAIEKCLILRFGSAEMPNKPQPLFSGYENEFENRRMAKEALRAAARKLMRGRASARSSTMTLQSAERWLWIALSKTAGGDPAAACRITGRREKLVSAQMSYGVIRHSHAESWRQQTLAHAGLLGGTALERQSDAFLGSRRTPSKSAILEMANRSSKALCAARDTNDVVDIHNAIALHTAAIIFLTTGLRPAAKAFLQFDSDGSFAYLFDKFIEDARVRAVPIAPICREQISLYRRHLEALLNRLPGEARRSIDQSVSHPSELPFFQLSPRMKPVSFNLASCWKSARMQLGNELPGNLQRHLLRTVLAGRANAEAIDAFFGHWAVGTEPWGRYSGLDPFLYRADIEPNVEKTVRDMGWKPEHGLTSSDTQLGDRAILIRSQRAQVGNLTRECVGSARRTLQSEPSPFNVALEHAAAPNFDERMANILALDSAELEVQLGQILASAIFHGALLDRIWFDPFLRAVMKVAVRSSRLSIEMEPPHPDDPNHVYAYSRRWFCDPTTEILIRQFRASAVASSNVLKPLPEAGYCLAQFIDSTAAGKPETVELFIKTSELRHRLRMPGILVSYANGEGPSLSLSSTTWERVSSGRRLIVARGRQDGERQEKQVFEHPKELSEIKSAISRNDVAEASQISDAISPNDVSLYAVVVRWAALAIQPRGRGRTWGRQKPYSADRTIYTYLLRLGPMFSNLLAFNINQLSADTLDEIYRAGLNQIGNAKTRNIAVNAIYNFQSYLCSVNDELDIGYSLDEYREEGRVSINAISNCDYRSALDQLNGAHIIAPICQLVLVLAFRTGMRLSEILGLRREDIAFMHTAAGKRSAEIYLRPHDARQLKTSHSRRMIPIDILMTESEIDLLEAWCKDRQAEANRRKNWSIFSGPGRSKKWHSTIRKEIEKALRKATGDQEMRFEHLRHTFATQLLACLLYPRDGSHLTIPKGLDETAISHERRDRIIARVSGDQQLGRAALQIVSQLCGHGPVTTTLRWYAHMLDWSVGAFTNRKIEENRVPSEQATAIVRRARPNFDADSLQRADRRSRAAFLTDPGQQAALGKYKVPPLHSPIPIADGRISVSILLKTATRSFQKTSLKAEPLFKLERRLPKRKSNVKSSLLSWTKVHDAVMELRSGGDPGSLDQLGELNPQLVSQWKAMADRLSGLRRPDEKRVRFQPKMSQDKLTRFDLVDWQKSFPNRPRGAASLMVVDWIWYKAIPHINDPNVLWALSEFCRFFSVDTGRVSFMKKKEARRFYRAMKKIGFAGSLIVAPLNSTRAEKIDEKVQRYWMNAPNADDLDTPIQACPRSIAIEIQVPKERNNDKTENQKGKPIAPTNNHTRYAVRFALLMLSIVSLKEIELSPRRRGRRPGYGGYL
jgi:integrase